MARKHVPGQLGLFRPESDWTPPTELPDLRGRPVLALDTENRDDGLGSGRGPGWALGPLGYICGVAWAAEGSVGYAPIRHPDTECLPQDSVMRWVNDHVRAGVRIVFHNSPYDVGWLGSYGVEPPEGDRLEDTLARAVLLDETQRSYSLDSCCERAGIPGKDVELLREAVRAYGGDAGNPAADLWRLPARYAGPYAEADALATLGLWHQQQPALVAQQLETAYRTEMELVPMVVAMRRRGIRLDVDKAQRVSAEFRRRTARILEELSGKFAMGRAVTIDDIRSPAWLEAAHRQEGIQFPLTSGTAKSASGAARGSFQKDWMEKHPHWLPQLVTRARGYHDAAEKFMDNFLLGFSHRGRIHAEVHQFLSEEGGTRSHRFSYSAPPLQQMNSPDKDPTMEVDGRKVVDLQKATGTLIRMCLLPEPGELWGSADYSQQEPRITVHMAAVCGATGAEAAVERYLSDPRTDYHTMVADMTGLPRPRAKIFNLAMTYGKGKHSLAEELGIPLEEAEALLEEYHRRLPFIKSLEEIAKRRASNRGFIRLLDGARMHYTQWEGGWLDYDTRQEALAAGKRLGPCSREEAVLRQSDPEHPWSRTRLRRADTRKALNNLIQGSAARQTKIAMRDMWREGILPLIQMHDEIGHSCGSERQRDRVEEIMRSAVQLSVPMVVDHEFGASWGEAKKSWGEAWAKMERTA